MAKDCGKNGILELIKQSDSSFNLLGKIQAKNKYLVEKRKLSNAFENYTNKSFNPGVLNSKESLESSHFSGSNNNDVVYP